MSGIAGVARTGSEAVVRKMLDKIAHRGLSSEIVSTSSATLGAVWSPHLPPGWKSAAQSHCVQDGPSEDHFARADANEGLVLKRDFPGVAPLYYGFTSAGDVCFASEVKALIDVTRDVHELPPGYSFAGQRLEAFDPIQKLPERDEPPEVLIKKLRQILEAAVEKRASMGPAGAWLSGGLDSSALAALARPHFQPFHTFTAGLPGAPDVEHAQVVAEHIRSTHHVQTVQVNDLLQALPEVIYHLESFDAWLVRSSVMNYLVARLAAGYTPVVFSGEGGDELFAGYEYLKGINPALLPDELVDLTNRLHNTALQRVDRCASAHGTQAHVVFLDPQVVQYAQQIPVQYKLYRGVEKWILRRAVEDRLPQSITDRPKAKFWEGAGVEECLGEYAEDKISSADFARERRLENGVILNTKEELLYYRIFRDHFGVFDDLSWMGRTKGSPAA